MLATVNDILREWRHLWPGGLTERDYSVLNLMAHCRHGELGYNRAECRSCHHDEWYASSCGDRHCPQCLGPRQAKWSEQVCGRLPDCPHFHVVFTVPAEFHEFFALNYRTAADQLFGAVAETLRIFQRNEWKMEGGFFGVLHTWGRALNWHPHIHLLVSAGGVRYDGCWTSARRNYLFPVRALSKVFRAVMLRRIEALDASREVSWPAGLAALEERRDWRLKLATKGWNVFSRPTLGNTRAVVRYLARYTSRIAISNHRIRHVDEGRETVSFEWKDYREGGRNREITLGGAEFIRRFTRHLVPKGLRRIRYFGLLAGRSERFTRLPGAPGSCAAERSLPVSRPVCKRCGREEWRYDACYLTRRACVEGFRSAAGLLARGLASFSLPPPTGAN
ncbi:transposase [Haloferula sp. A504]|uniref:IS91 family transposase n=1 Tax=Haloferula sp. A504 TaxID=3373601 RepID=UPI0031C9BE57|nr:transposase [Verrucomicrobiaceae bacterium E54]